MTSFVESYDLTATPESFGNASRQASSTHFLHISNNKPSLCIPRISKKITREHIYNIFNGLNIGTIYRIDIKEINEIYQCIFIHINWNDSDIALKARKRLISGRDVKIMYDDPWFWKVSVLKNSEGYKDIEKANIEKKNIEKKEKCTDDFILVKSSKKNKKK